MSFVRFLKRTAVGLFLCVSANAATIGLGDYEIALGQVNVSGVNDNLSGITFNSTTDTLFSVINEPEEIRELNTDGSLIRTITLPAQMEDTEGIVHLGGTLFAFTEERKRNIVVMDLADVTPSNTIDLADLTVLSLDIPGTNNLGLEGLAFDANTDTMYVTMEKSTPTIYSFSLSGAMAGGAAVPYPVSTFSVNTGGMSDLTGLHFDEETGNLLVLSHESQRLIEVATSGANAGQELSSISLAGIPQAEGVTMGPGRIIYLVSEADRFYVLENPEPAVPEPAVPILLITSAAWFITRRRTHSHAISSR